MNPSPKNPTPGSPSEPWEDDFFPAAGSDEAKLRFLVRYAVLAPSSHNAQPWLWEASGDRLDLYADWNRALPVSDPAGRELLIGCGAALLHLRAALRHFGYAGEIEIFPSATQPELLARVRLGEAVSTDPEWEVLFAAIPQRHTNRSPFQNTPLPPTLTDALCREAAREDAWLRLTQRGAAEHDTLLNLIVHGDQMQWHDPQFRREWADWLRANHSSATDGIPGHAVGLGEAASLLVPFSARLRDDSERHAAQDRLLLESAPVLAVLGTENNTMHDWIAAGQAMARVLLRASAEGVAASFFNQPVEIGQLESHLEDIIGRTDAPQLVFRLGYPSAQTQATPRREAGEVTTFNVALHQATEHFRKG